jgi:hypothetical protein
MAMSPWLNTKRLKDYPRLVFIASWVVLLLNIILHRGWIGGLTNYLLWGDFIDYYAAGKLYLNNITQLYDLKIQGITQLNIIGSTQTIGLSFFSYPPNAALLYSALTYLPLLLVVILWCVLALICIATAARLMKQYLIPDWLKDRGFSTFQLSILILSSFSFIEGFEKGQSHAQTLLLTVLILISTKREKWLLAGLLAALSTYKPQFVIGFLFLWLMWGKYKAILSFLIFSSIWNGSVLLTKGIGPYLAFLKLANQVMYLPYTSGGFPNFIMVTPFSLIASIMSINVASIWEKIFLVLGGVLLIFFAILASKFRKRPVADQNIILALATILPLIIFPYALLHDLLILFPVIILLSTTQENEKVLKYLAVGIYIAMLLLPILGYLFNMALPALIPIAVFIYCCQQSLRLLRT